jgi:hemerythrin
MAKNLFDFETEFRLGIENVDKEHETLVNMLNQVHNLISEGKREEARSYFNETLTLYVNEHFSNEEAFMESIGYEHLEEHKKIHQQFKDSFQDLKPKIDSADDAAFRNALNDTFTWIINHIGRTDKKYANYLKNK